MVVKFVYTRQQLFRVGGSGTQKLQKCSGSN